MWIEFSSLSSERIMLKLALNLRVLNMLATATFLRTPLPIGVI
jgi:hypothetical protein